MDDGAQDGGGHGDGEEEEVMKMGMTEEEEGMGLGPDTRQLSPATPARSSA